WGSQLRPSAAKPISVSLPKITVLADKPNATATVDMTLSSNLRETPPYSLTLTITPANASQSVKFAVSFGHFPRPASGTGPLHRSRNASYTVIDSSPGPSGAASRSKPFTYTSSRPIGENSLGAQLRVAFPDLGDKQPGFSIHSGMRRRSEPPGLLQHHMQPAGKPAPLDPAIA